MKKIKKSGLVRILIIMALFFTNCEFENNLPYRFVYHVEVESESRVSYYNHETKKEEVVVIKDCWTSEKIVVSEKCVYKIAVSSDIVDKKIVVVTIIDLREEEYIEKVSKVVEARGCML